MLCTRLCPAGAITVENNLAHIDYEKCIQCGACVQKCPAHVILPPSERLEAEQEGSRHE